MTRHANTHRWIPDLVQFTTIVVELVIVNVAIGAAQQQPGLAASVLPWSVITYGLLSGSLVWLGGWLENGAAFNELDTAKWQSNISIGAPVTWSDTCHELQPG